MLYILNKSLMYFFYLILFSHISFGNEIYPTTLSLPEISEDSNLNLIHDSETEKLSYSELLQLNIMTIKAINLENANETKDELMNNSKSNLSSKVSAITEAQAYSILKLANKNQVVGLDSVKKYDPSELIGFCFGRALYIQLELLRHGVKKDSIRKAFVLGAMSGQGSHWRFHVSTIVKNQAGGWLAIDPVFKRVIKLEDWYVVMKKGNYGEDIRLYITEQKRLSPNIGKPYIGTNDNLEINNESIIKKWLRIFNEPVGIDRNGIFSKDYHNYFKDMFAYLKENPIDVTDKFNYKPEKCRIFPFFNSFF